jgi:hypothetical protein
VFGLEVNLRQPNNARSGQGLEEKGYQYSTVALNEVMKIPRCYNEGMKTSRYINMDSSHTFNFAPALARDEIIDPRPEVIPVITLPHSPFPPVVKARSRSKDDPRVWGLELELERIQQRLHAFQRNGGCKPNDHDRLELKTILEDGEEDTLGHVFGETEVGGGGKCGEVRPAGPRLCECEWSVG